jgi:hypothetical protein
MKKSKKKEIKDLQKKEGRSLGQIISQLLAEALGSRKVSTQNTQLKWTSRPMKALVDLSDQKTLFRILEGNQSFRPTGALTPLPDSSIRSRNCLASLRASGWSHNSSRV